MINVFYNLDSIFIHIVNHSELLSCHWEFEEAGKETSFHLCKLRNEPSYSDYEWYASSMVYVCLAGHFLVPIYRTENHWRMIPSLCFLLFMAGEQLWGHSLFFMWETHLKVKNSLSTFCWQRFFWNWDIVPYYSNWWER